MARTTAARGAATPAAKAVKTTRPVAVTPVAGAGRTPPKPAAAKTAAKTPAPKAAARGAGAKAAAVKPAPVARAKAAVKPAPVVRAKAAAPARLAKEAARGLAGAGQAKGKAAPARSEADDRPVLVRDSFTMPEREYAVLGSVKQACLQAGFEIKKSELLRIGVALLGQLDAAALRTVLDSLPQLKTGRPPAA